jgi:5'-nucleotidase
MPDVALQNGGGIRNDEIVPAGQISELKTFNILPFSNFVTIVEAISPTQFKEILENAVSRVEDVSGRFAQVAGFSFEYNPSGTPGSRVINVVLDDATAIVTGGSVVPGAPNVNIATIDFLARGGDQYPFGSADFTILGTSYQQALKNYIVDGLGGAITAGQYPVGGEGRITAITP